MDIVYGALAKTNSYGFVGILMGMFDLTATGITSAIIFSFVFALIFKPSSLENVNSTLKD